MKILAVVALCLFSVSSSAQLLKKIKDQATNRAKGEANQAKNEAKYKARQGAYKELDDFKAEFDSTDIDYALLLSDNSGLFGGRGRNEAGTKFMRLSAIAKSLYQDQDMSNEEAGRLNLHFGQSAYATGRFVYAGKRLSAAQFFFEKAGMQNDLSYLKTVASQGLLYTSMGRFSQAEKFTSKALELREDKLGKENMAVAASLNNYAVLHYNLGQYNESEKEFASAINVIKSNKQQDAMAYAIVLNNQAILYQSMGRYEQAVKSFETGFAAGR